MFTGEAGGGARDLDKQQAQGKWQINGGGPMMIDFCRLLTGSQGSMGIVTWASVKCEPISERNVRHTVAADKEEDLIDFVYELLRLRFTDGLYILNDAYLAHLAGEAKVDIAPWQAVIEISGHNFLPDLRISQQQGDISDFAAKHGLTLSEHTEGLFALTHGPKVLPANERLFFITTLERTPAFIAEMNRMASELGIDPAQIGVYIQPQHQGTNCHCEFLLPDCAQAPALYFAAAERFAGMGAYYSRPQGPILTNLQLGKDPQTAHTMATVKGIFDPKNIMNPGKLTLKEDAK